jgi:hypothetical protein
MATAASIKTAIKKRVDNSKTVDYSLWTIGITTDPDERKDNHNDPKHWQQWEADSLEIAQEVETYFINDYPEKKSDRMKGGTGGDMSARKTAYVYIF